MLTKPRVLIVITRPDRAGAQKHVESILTSNLAYKYEFYLVTGSYGYLTEVCRTAGVDFQVVEHLQRELSIPRDLKAIRSLQRIIRELSPCLVHLHSAKAGLVGRIAAHLNSVPVVYTVHGWPFADGVSWFRRLFSLFVERRLASYVDHLILVSKYDLELGKQKKIIRSNTRFRVIHNGIDSLPDRPFKNVDSFSEHVRLITVTRLAEQKNLACMIRAMVRLKGEWKLTIVGYGPEASKLKDMVAGLNLESRIQFKGEVENVSELLRTADVFLLSSRWEGLPIALLEALRAGLSIVATDVGGVPEVVSENENGYLVPSQNDKLFTARVQRLIDDPSKRKMFSLAALSKFSSCFTSDKMIGSTLEVYKKVVGNAQEAKS